MGNEILVIGGTGNTGAPLVDLLKDSDQSYRVMVRSDESESKMASKDVPTVRAELGDWPSVAAALENIDTVFLVSSPSPDMSVLHKGLIDCALSANVRKVVRISAEPARYSKGLPMYEQHTEVDNYLMAAGLDYVILRPHYFMQNIPQMHASFIKEKQMFAQYLGDTRIPMVDTRDIAKAAFIGLTSDEFNRQIQYITGPQAISFSDVAKAFSKSLGKDVQYVNLPYEDQKAGLEAFGTPDMIVETVMKLFKLWAEGEDQPASNDFEKMTGSTATDIDAFAQEFALAL
ncbi:NmrA family NAD(P)-binding protein [Parasedimentitalea psychrophila]|uniref:NmrA family NAD(P)-binding protein n=1 Tax=Parasedimentitalea psychrophila TaxID=2997337 RepID=A0A9Y2KV41_9RHOB|nr:NmrA family NAD(P)-binding protein [Parasedimentitalea psychrophila]WIY23720.1 NmrA family NAD(P)-binding protein [Parasedimentitalea psychrophila]